MAYDFKDAFNRTDLDKVPAPEELDTIWAYINYHLNFRPLSFESRPAKQVQKLQYVTNISDLVAPENAIAMYFQGYLQLQVHGSIDPGLIENLEKRLALSPYWSARFRDFNLSPTHLKTRDFPIHEAPDMVSAESMQTRV